MLRSDRVTLRALEREDLDRLHELHNDLEVEALRREDPPRPKTREEIRIALERGGEDWFGIEVDRALIGEAGLHTFDPTSRHCGLGIAIGDRAYWGRGYGRETVALLLEYAFRHHNLRRVWLSVLASNVRAVRSFAASGFVEEGRLREHAWLAGGYVDEVRMGLLRSEWESGRGGN
jgi:RimJ/RimL family protein N-acetyltransferase